MATYTIANTLVDGVGVPRIAHEQINAGQFVYLDLANQERARLAVNTSLEASIVAGIAMNSAYEHQPVNVAVGVVTLSATPTLPGVARWFALSGTPGAMMDIADLAVGQFATLIGFSVTTSQLNIVPIPARLAYS